MRRHQAVRPPPAPPPPSPPPVRRHPTPPHPPAFPPAPVGHPLSQGMQLATFPSSSTCVPKTADWRVRSVYTSSIPRSSVPVRRAGSDAYRHRRRSGDPLADLPPGDRIVEPSVTKAHRRWLRQHAGDFGRRAGLAVRQPHARHPAAVAQGVEPLVIDGRRRLQVEHHHRTVEPLHDGQDRRRQMVGGHIEEHQIDLLAGEERSRFERAGRAVHHAGVRHLHARVALHPIADARLIAFQFIEQAVELAPVGIEPRSEQADFCVGIHKPYDFFRFLSQCKSSTDRDPSISVFDLKIIQTASVRFRFFDLIVI